MATPVEFRTFTPEDSRLDLQRRIASAPREHAEAVLESYDLLQRLHDCGMLAIANGLLSAGPTVIAKLTDVVSSAPAVTALRIGLALGKIATAIDASRVEQLVADGRPHLPGGGSSDWLSEKRHDRLWGSALVSLALSAQRLQSNTRVGH